MTTPPTIKTHEVDEPPSLGEFCGICRRQVPRYTCPSCNLFYCSLSCFRSEAHSQCSETFYRKEIETGIKSDSPGTEKDRNKMLELLKLMQEERAADDAALFRPFEEEEEEDSLVHRLSGIDISSASTNDLLRLLNKEEKDKFFSGLKDPASGLVQQLFGSAEFEMMRRLPWWEAPSDESQSLSSPRISYGVKPELMVVPTNLINHAARGTSLLYNTCVVFLAYTYVTRHLSMSPLGLTTNDPLDQHKAREILLQSVPFLGDSKSKLVHLSLNDAVISFWSRLDSRTVDKQTMLVLLDDTVKLMRPRWITPAVHDGNEGTGSLTANHPFSRIVMVVSDISTLFSACHGPPVAARRSSHIVMKLTFYAAHILSTPSSRIHALAEEIRLFSERMASEAP